MNVSASKRYYNAKLSAYLSYLKRNISLDFYICTSVLLRTKSNIISILDIQVLYCVPIRKIFKND